LLDYIVRYSKDGKNNNEIIFSLSRILKSGKFYKVGGEGLEPTFYLELDLEENPFVGHLREIPPVQIKDWQEIKKYTIKDEYMKIKISKES
jgi:hypothetical protein